MKWVTAVTCRTEVNQETLQPIGAQRGEAVCPSGQQQGGGVRPPAVSGAGYRSSIHPEFRLKVSVLKTLIVLSEGCRE